MTHRNHGKRSMIAHRSKSCPFSPVWWLELGHTAILLSPVEYCSIKSYNDAEISTSGIKLDINLGCNDVHRFKSGSEMLGRLLS